MLADHSLSVPTDLAQPIGVVRALGARSLSRGCRKLRGVASLPQDVANLENPQYFPWGAGWVREVGEDVCCETEGWCCLVAA